MLKGIELANACDLKYKTSRNQRLLVELCLMQLASITFDGEKKNSKRYIIPPSYFTKLGIKPIPVTKPETPAQTNTPTEIGRKTVSSVQQPAIKTAITTNAPPKIILDRTKRASSGLSLSSIRAKKEHVSKKKETVVDEANLPREPFDIDDLMPVWHTFINKLRANGKMNLASILGIDTPKLKGTTIYLEFPNSTNKIEVERQQFDLMQYLRKSLKNYDISLNITVNEEVQKRFAYTAEEKYEKLKEINPNIELLRGLFDLDI